MADEQGTIIGEDPLTGEVVRLDMQGHLLSPQEYFERLQAMKAAEPGPEEYARIGRLVCELFAQGPAKICRSAIGGFKVHDGMGGEFGTYAYLEDALRAATGK